MIKQWLFWGLLLVNAGASAQAKKLFPVSLVFENVVGEKPLNTDSGYANTYGEAFTVRNFRYYISHLTFTGATGKEYPFPNDYFLIDVRKPESLTVTVQLPSDTIRAIRFTIGVDSLKNVSGVQAGALDPANGMFWTWNSGYIFAKLEGNSPQSRAPQNSFTYHIGGFRTGENAQRRISLPVLKKTNDIRQTSIVIQADVNAWFAGNASIKIAELSSVMTPGAQAAQIADNYSKMFSIRQAD